MNAKVNMVVRWVISVVVIAVVVWVLWLSGLFGKVQQQPAAQVQQSANGMSASTDTSNSALAQDSSAIGSQLQVLTTDQSNINDSLNDTMISQDGTKDVAVQEIDRRTQNLGSLSAGIKGMQKVTDAFRKALMTNTQMQLSNLAALKAKVNSETDASALKADAASLTSSYGVYTLVMPQGLSAVGADQVITVATMIMDLGQKLQARITAMQKSGENVSSFTTALTDFSAKITDASKMAQAAVVGTAPLMPANGNSAKAAANVAALKAAYQNIAVAQQDLVAAHGDADMVIGGLK